MTIHLIATCAYNIKQLTPENKIVRKTEYTIALQKLIHYNLPLSIIISECSKNNYSSSFFTKLPIEKSLTDFFLIEDTSTLGATTKSQQEFMSIQHYIHNIKDTHKYNDEDWIVKLSGRYIFMSDYFMKIVENMDSKINVVFKMCDPEQAFTFCFAMRWKYFKEFYSLPLELLGNKNVEKFIVEFVQYSNLANSAINIDKLDILSNINTEDKYKIY